MNSLFTTKSVFTYDEYKRFNWELSGKKSFIYFAIICPLMVVLGLFANSWIFVTLGFAFPIVMFATYKYSLRKNFNSNKGAQNLEATYNFYEDHFDVKDAKSEASLEYKYLYKIIFTKTNVYLMIGKVQGYMLIKENFPEGLEEFLKSVAPAKKKK